MGGRGLHGLVLPQAEPGLELRNLGFNFFFSITLASLICAQQVHSDLGKGFYVLWGVVWGANMWHMEVPRLGVESEQQLQAYARATATPDLRCICNLHCSSHDARSLTH